MLLYILTLGLWQTPPLRAADSLKVVALPIYIDRYKIPGLNNEMTEIANDMAYGYGTEHQGTIYADTDTLADYKRENQLNGFDPVAHALFSNAADFDVRALLEETPPETSVYSSSPADNTRVERRNPVKLENARIADFNRNRKAVYTRQEMYKAVYRLPIGETEWSIPISTGLDIWVFDSLPASALFFVFESAQGMELELTVGVNRKGIFHPPCKSFFF